jgi:hypothetical protein
MTTKLRSGEKSLIGALSQALKIVGMKTTAGPPMILQEVELIF